MNFSFRVLGVSCAATLLMVGTVFAQNPQQQRMQQMQMQRMQQQRAIQQQQRMQQMQQQRAQQQRMQQMQQQRAQQQRMQQMQQQRAQQQRMQQMQQQRAQQQRMQQMQQQRVQQQQQRMQQLQQQRVQQQQQRMQQLQQQRQQGGPRGIGQQRPGQPGFAPQQNFGNNRPGQFGRPQPGQLPQQGFQPQQNFGAGRPGQPPVNQFGRGQPGRGFPGGAAGAAGVGAAVGLGVGGIAAANANRGPADLRAIRAQRQIQMENNGRMRVIREPGMRTIIRQDNRAFIFGDDRNRFNRFGRANTLNRPDGTTVSIINRPGGVQIVSVYDRFGRLIERRRRGGGRDFVFFSNRRNRAIGMGALIAAPLVLAPLALSMPRERYVVEYEQAPPEVVYEALSAPPVQRLERRYTMDEVLQNRAVRDRMRSVDLNDINFASGSWDIPQQYYNRLGRVAEGILKVIQNNPREVFLVEGHTDAIGEPEDNLTLSDRRAEAVAVLLTQQFNVPPENLMVQGYGEQNLKVQTDAAEPRNRRVTIRRVTPLLAQEGQPNGQQQ